jgi:hypothetical protein
MPNVSSSKKLQRIYEELVDHSKSSTWTLLNKLEKNQTFDSLAQGTVATVPTTEPTGRILAKTTERDQKRSPYRQSPFADDSSYDDEMLIMTLDK